MPVPVKQKKKKKNNYEMILKREQNKHESLLKQVRVSDGLNKQYF